MTVKARRGRRPTRRDPDDTFEGAAFADLVDELPGEDLDLEREVRRLEMSSSSAAYAIRRRD